jgi:ferrous iron transport protein A
MGDSLVRNNTEGYLDVAPKGKPLRVIRLTEGDLSLKLMEMGCLPGQWVEIVHRTATGHALALQVAEYVLALRAEEARAVLVRWGESPLVDRDFSALSASHLQE